MLYEAIPYKVIKVTKGNGYYLQNIVSLSVIRRHYDDLKTICIKSELDEALNLPQPVVDIMYNLKYEHLAQDFPFLKNPSKRARVVTRQQAQDHAKLLEEEQDDFHAFMEDMEKEVSFEDEL